jgi:hypothetical protein
MGCGCAGIGPSKLTERASLVIDEAALRPLDPGQSSALLATAE